MKNRYLSSSGLSAQRGATLLVGLVMLLLMTVIGLAAMRGSGMQELMASNMRDRNLAFQAAEAGLRAGEEKLDDAVLPDFDTAPSDGHDGYVVAIDGSSNSGFWDSYGWDNNSVLTSMEIDGISRQPRYVIEEITSTGNIVSDGGAIDFQSTLSADDTIYYRVTSRGTGGTDSAEVILQSTYKR